MTCLGKLQKRQDPQSPVQRKNARVKIHFSNSPNSVIFAKNNPV